jgi:hypothetical protein
MRRLFLIPLLLFALPALGQTIACGSGFASSGSCGVSFPGAGGEAWGVVGTTSGSTPGLSGSAVDLLTSSCNHCALSLLYQTPVNEQAFTGSFQFTLSGWALAFVLENNTNTDAGPAGPNFSAGAGCEAGFYQGFSSNNLSSNNIYALSFSSNDSLTAGGSGFTYSGVQTFVEGQSPCNPNLGGTVPYVGQNKFSTSPVPLNSPASSQNTTTTDNYQVNVWYTGTTFVMTMYDITAGGTCTPVTSGTCFTNTWTGVNIPSAVGGNTAYVGITAGTGSSPILADPVLISSFVYNVLSAANAPTFSPPAGSYSGTQSVTISSTSGGAIKCYNTTGSPATNGTTGCESGSTLYTGPVSVSSSETLYAVAGGTGFGDSSISSAAYTISGGTPAVPVITGVKFIGIQIP